MASSNTTPSIAVSPTAVRRTYTLFLIRKRDDVLLGMRKQGFGTGKWNGFGGEVGSNETIVEAALRELKEECGLTTKLFRKFAIITFEFIEGDHIIEGHLYSSYAPEGEPVETEEMRPQWFPIDSIPFEQMSKDGKHWFPLWLTDRRFVAWFKFLDPDVLIDHIIREVDDPSEDLVPMR